MEGNVVLADTRLGMEALNSQGEGVAMGFD